VRRVHPRVDWYKYAFVNDQAGIDQCGYLSSLGDELITRMALASASQNLEISI